MITYLKCGKTADEVNAMRDKGYDAGAPDGREGRKSVAFLDALYRSAKTGDPVAL